MIAISLDCGCKGTAFFESGKLFGGFFAIKLKLILNVLDYQCFIFKKKIGPSYDKTHICE